MFSRFYETELRWRRAAVYRPVRIARGETKKGPLHGQSLSGTCHAGMRVLLRREPSCHDRNAISLFANGGRRIGTLPAEIAEWVAPLLDSGKTAFDAEIWSLENNECEQAPDAPVCRLMLTQHDFASIKRLSFKRLSLSGWWSRDGRSRPKSPPGERRGDGTHGPSIRFSSPSANVANPLGRMVRRTNAWWGRRQISDSQVDAGRLLARNRLASAILRLVVSGAGSR
jgi:hypothetical protein